MTDAERFDIGVREIVGKRLTPLRRMLCGAHRQGGRDETIN
jgi:hypothetical protein